MSKSDEIGKMSVGQSYKLTAMWVREFREKYLTTAKTECEVTEVNDITDVKPYDESNVKIVGVEKIDGQKIRSTKCEMLQAFNNCVSIISTRVTVKTPTGTNLHLQVFNEVLHCQSDL